MYHKEPEYQTMEKIRYLCNKLNVPFPSELNSPYGEAWRKVLDYISVHGTPYDIQVRTNSPSYGSGTGFIYTTNEIRMRFSGRPDYVIAYMDDPSYYRGSIASANTMPAPSVAPLPGEPEKKVNNKLLLLL
jgi:hypothetical protein